MGPTATKLLDRASYRTARALSALPPAAMLRLAGGAPVVRDGERLEPEVQLTLSLMERQGEPPLSDLSVPAARERSRRQGIAFAGPTVPAGAVRDLEVDGAAGPLPARLYSPEESGGPHPLLVFFHGGGFTVGDLDTHDGPCRLLCRHAGAHVLAVEYRLAPEHPWPAAPEDCWAALGWAAAHAAGLGADPDRLAVGGDSAGGNLSAVVAQRAAREGGPALRLQLLIYPSTDASVTYPSEDRFAEGFFLTKSEIAWFTRNYCGTDFDAAHPALSPLRAPDLADLAGLAPALVVTAGFDPLRDEGDAYAEALRTAGTVVYHRRMGGMIHGFINMGGVSRVSRDAVIELAGISRAMLAR